MKVIAKYYGGSYAYGLANKDSDLDERYLFLNTEVSKIIGLDKHQYQVTQNDKKDSVGYELRHFLNLLRKGNTGALELLFNEYWLENSEEFEEIIYNREGLLDTDRLFKCLCGYCHSERRFVLGERTGKLGGKRFESLEKYGYSHKNLVQYMRLCHAGAEFFQTGHFPVDTTNMECFDDLYDIKNNPSNYDKQMAEEYMEDALELLHDSYDTKKVNFKFDDDLANLICLDLYGGMIADLL